MSLLNNKFINFPKSDFFSKNSNRVKSIRNEAKFQEAAINYKDSLLAIEETFKSHYELKDDSLKKFNSSIEDIYIIRKIVGKRVFNKNKLFLNNQEKEIALEKISNEVILAEKFFDFSSTQLSNEINNLISNNNVDFIQSLKNGDIIWVDNIESNHQIIGVFNKNEPDVDKQIIYYSELLNGLDAGTVAYSKIKEFAGENSFIHSYKEPKNEEHGKKIIERAMTSLEKDKKNLPSKNCDHIAYWYYNGKSFSPKIINLLSIPMRSSNYLETKLKNVALNLTGVRDFFNRENKFSPSEKDSREFEEKVNLFIEKVNIKIDEFNMVFYELSKFEENILNLEKDLNYQAIKSIIIRLKSRTFFNKFGNFIKAKIFSINILTEKEFCDLRAYYLIIKDMENLLLNDFFDNKGQILEKYLTKTVDSEDRK